MFNLIHGDCIEELKTICDFDVGFTSPPYNRKRNDKYDNYDDTIDDFYEFMQKFTNLLLEKCRKYIIVNIQKNFYNKQDVFKYIGHYSDIIQDIIIWQKSNPMPSSGKNLTNAYEFFIVIGTKEQLKSNKTYTKNIITTSVNSESTTEIHKAVMKQEVSDWFIENFTNENDTVCDCFMGLGTTGISCVKYKRNFIGIELNKEYFDIARQRIETEQKKPRQMKLF
jgi:DNA modification methylase